MCCVYVFGAVRVSMLRLALEDRDGEQVLFGGKAGQGGG